MMALMRRSHELNIIGDTHYRYLMQAMARYRIEEPVSTPKEIPSLFNELIVQYKNEYNYSDDEISQILNIHREMYKDLYVKSDSIRLVK